MAKLFDKFNQEFENQLSKHQKMADAFEAANESFSKRTGFSAYSDFNSFKSSRSQKRKKSKSS